MGTPQFSCAALQKLIDDKEFEIVAVYTREPQPAKRGQQLTNSPIHELALKYGLKVITPKTLKKSEIQAEFAAFKADAAVVLAYGLILPQAILDATKYGCVNIHPSILPRWRGPSPIQYTLLNGDEEIGVTIIKMDAGIDSGNMLMQEKFKIDTNSNYATLAPKLSEMGASMLVDSLKKLREGKIKETKQDDALATFSKKLNKEDAKINWNLSADEILRKIRALSGSLTAYFDYNGEIIKVFSAQIIKGNSGRNFGEIDKDFIIECGQDRLQPLILQRQGKKTMNVKEFLLGFKL